MLSAPGTLKNVYYLNKGKNVENDNGEAVDYLTFSNKAKMVEKLNNNGSNSFTTSTTTYAYNLRNPRSHKLFLSIFERYFSLWRLAGKL